MRNSLCLFSPGVSRAVQAISQVTRWRECWRIRWLLGLEKIQNRYESCISRFCGSLKFEHGVKDFRLLICEALRSKHFESFAPLCLDAGRIQLNAFTAGIGHRPFTTTGTMSLTSPQKEQKAKTDVKRGIFLSCVTWQRMCVRAHQEHCNQRENTRTREHKGLSCFTLLPGGQPLKTLFT